MQAVFILAIFSMVLAIMAGMISNGLTGSAQIQADRIQETRSFFIAMSKVVLNDITRQYLHGNPNGAGVNDIKSYITNLDQLSQLSSGLNANPASDAWGRALQGRVFTGSEILQTQGSNNIVVPVTGIAFVSSGPDGIFQTTLPSVTQLSQITGIVAPAGSDDIVVTFNNRTAQEDQFEQMQALLRRISTAAIKDLQGRISEVRQIRLAKFQKDIADGKEVDMSKLGVENDANPPNFLKLDSTKEGIANRNNLGVDKDFEALERLVGKGRMQVTATAPAKWGDPLILKLTNSSVATPWGTSANPLNYQIAVTMDGSHIPCKKGTIRCP